jgi:hypothetical protein
MKQTNRRRKTNKTDLAALSALDRSIEPMLHTACVRAGAAAALQVSLDRLPLLKPLVPEAVRRATRSDAAERSQKELIRQIYLRYKIKPALWETEAILAVAQTQSLMSPLATSAGLESVLKAWLPRLLVKPLMRYTPLQPLVIETTRAVATTWAAGRYADAACRMRKMGVDWLPAPVQDALKIAPNKLKQWSAEALTVALPPLKMAAQWGKNLASLSAEIAQAGVMDSAPKAARNTLQKPRKKSAVKKTARGKTSTKKNSR